MSQFASYFLTDPLRILYLIGGSGGIWYWISLYLNRVRITVKLVSEKYELAEEPYLIVKSVFEIENLGNNRTSLQPVVKFSGYDKDGVNHRELLVVVDGTERTLEPFKPSEFELLVKARANYPFVFFRTYRFGVSRGSGAVLRIRNENKEVLGLFAFYIERAIFAINNVCKAT